MSKHTPGPWAVSDVGEVEGGTMTSNRSTKHPPLIYVAGPYRAPTAWGIEKNIHEARKWGTVLVENEAYPVIPHANTAHFDGLAPDAFFLSGTLALMLVCDGVLFIPGWKGSSGAREEYARAKAHGMPVFDVTEDEDLKKWVEEIGATRRKEKA